ncbi:hypothetical protein WDU94_006305 [Cyamophila willieti]
MSRRKSAVTKRSEYVAHEETSIRAQKRKFESDVESDFLVEDCEWEQIQSNPKMMKVNRVKPSSSSSVTDHDYDIELNMDSRKHCTNRNALMARRNRIKKKIYVEKLENTIEELRNNYESMQKQILEQNEVIARVTKENRYLRNVISNSSGLKQILQGVRLAGLANHSPAHPVHSTTPMSRDPNFNQKVHVTEDAFPSSTTCNDVLDNLKLEVLDSVKPVIPVHDYSSNPQLYYDTIPERRKWQTRDDLSI